MNNLFYYLLVQPAWFLFVAIGESLWFIDDIISVLDNRRNKAGRGRTLERFKICILFLFVFAFSGMALSQSITIRYNTDGSVDLHFATVKDWEEYKLNNIKLHDDLQVKDSVINYSLKPAIVKLQNANKQADSSILFLTKRLDVCEKQQSMLVDDVINSSTDNQQSSLKWDGLIAGLRTGYLFTSSELNKSTFTSALINNFSAYCKAGFRIVKFVVSTILDIPFDKNRSTSIMVDFGFLIL